MKSFKISSLRSKLIFSFLGVAVLPLLLLSLLNLRTTQKALTNNANQTLLAAASQTALSLDAFISSNLDAVRVEAQLPALAKYLSLPDDQRQNIAEEVEAILRSLSRKDTLNISSYALIDRQGRNVLDTHTPDIDQDKSNRDYFQQPVKTGLPFVSPIRYSPTTNLPSLFFSSPVRNASGQILGVLRVRYNAAVIQRLVTQNTDLVGRLDSYAIVLDENYIRLAQGYAPELMFKSLMPLPPAKVKALQTEGRLPQGSTADISTNLPAFKQGLENAANTPFFTTLLSPNSNDLKAAAVTKLKTQPWFVVFVQSQAAFLEPVQEQVYQTLLLALIIGGVVVFAAITIGELLAKPLINLTGTVTQFTAGNLNARTFIRSKDEVGILAASFNTMAEQVGKLFKGLEDRTRELEISQHVTVAVSELSRSILEPERLLREAITLMQNRFKLHYVRIYLLDQTTNQLIARADSIPPGKGEKFESNSIPLNANDSLVALVARTQETIWVDDFSSASSLEAGLKSSRAGSEVTVPLITRGTFLGVLDIQDSQPHRFSETDLETFNTLAGQIATALENARLFDEIQKAEERFRSIFEDAPIGMAIVSLETHQLLQVNKVLCEMLGYTGSELNMRTFEEVTHPEDIELDVSLFKQMIAGQLAIYQIEKRYLKPNQEIVWGNLTVTLIRDRNGAACYALGMLENITERKQVQAALQQSESQYREKAQELEQAMQELQQTQTQLIQTEKMSSLGQMVAGVAHEINNPVNFIYGNIQPANEYLQDVLDLLDLYQQHYPKPAPEIQDRIEEIDLEFLIDDFQKIMSSMKLGAERIRQIVLSLRNFSRLDESDMKPVDIHEGLENTLLILQNQLKEKPGHPEILVIKEYEELPLVECYAGQLNQVFMNLLTNAIDAIDDYNQQRSLEEIKENPSTIGIRTQLLEGNYVEIRIINSGPGIPEDILQKIFDPFFTTKTVGKGTGLGLAISYQIIVEKHNGKLYCKSTAGEGAEFVIQIPTKVENRFSTGLSVS
ncbi:ATP-binding protein [Microcoleus sp. FACHB-68]|uniref:ATP-binding protein n=1 Tax=Microcoleus sp. FACHB-68 TaxID=2692826 RepID=UPI0016823ABF|nr:ATP-binding protein [Microcoleus sp. FACHB-68]MBD1936800.1 PAS domain S-box protein [Microcoleus sp. FACHB-68]